MRSQARGVCVSWLQMWAIALSSSYLCRLREWFIHQLGGRLGLLFLCSINTHPTLNLMPWGRCCPSRITSQACACGSFTFPRQTLNHQPGHNVLFLSLRILAHFLGADWCAESSLFKTQGWLALCGGGGCVTLLYVHRWSAILACLHPDSLRLCFGWRRDEFACIGLRTQMYVWVRASQVLNLDLRGVLGLLVMAKLRDCLVGGSVWTQIDVKWCCFDRCIVSPEGWFLDTLIMRDMSSTWQTY